MKGVDRKKNIKGLLAHGKDYNKLAKRLDDLPKVASKGVGIAHVLRRYDDLPDYQAAKRKCGKVQQHSKWL